MVKVWRNKNVKEGKSKVKEKFLSAENTNKRGKCTMASVALQNYNIMRLERAVEVVGVHLLSTDLLQEKIQIMDLWRVEWKCTYNLSSFSSLRPFGFYTNISY